eukprot:1073089-Pleurochrysis_carterae.AAC.1
MDISAETAQKAMEPVSWELYEGKDSSLPKHSQSSTQVAHIGDLLLDDCFREVTLASDVEKGMLKVRTADGGIMERTCGHVQAIKK